MLYFAKGFKSRDRCHLSLSPLGHILATLFVTPCKQGLSPEYFVVIFQMKTCVVLIVSWDFTERIFVLSHYQV